MHIKIQGGGDGKYSNKGSCSSLVSYLQHEDLENIKKGCKIQPFFSHTEDDVKANKIIEVIDNNKQKLCRADAKFFMITYSPSEDELNVLGQKPELQIENLKKFVREGLMDQYARNFQKDLTAKDLMYFAKIHLERNKTKGKKDNMHVHILISRKSLDGRLKLSPQTNHRNTSSGAVKGGFVRTSFFNHSEKVFDKMFNYDRKIENKFRYKNAFKQAKSAQRFNLLRVKQLLEKQPNLDRDAILHFCQKNEIKNNPLLMLLGDINTSTGSIINLLNDIDRTVKKENFVSIDNSINSVPEDILDQQRKKRKKKFKR